MAQQVGQQDQRRRRYTRAEKIVGAILETAGGILLDKLPYEQVFNLLNFGGNLDKPISAVKLIEASFGAHPPILVSLAGTAIFGGITAIAFNGAINWVLSRLNRQVESINGWIGRGVLSPRRTLRTWRRNIGRDLNLRKLGLRSGVRRERAVTPVKRRKYGELQRQLRRAGGVLRRAATLELLPHEKRFEQIENEAEKFREQARSIRERDGQQQFAILESLRNELAGAVTEFEEAKTKRIKIRDIEIPLGEVILDYLEGELARQVGREKRSETRLGLANSVYPAQKRINEAIDSLESLQLAQREKETSAISSLQTGPLMTGLIKETIGQKSRRLAAVQAQPVREEVLNVDSQIAGVIQLLESVDCEKVELFELPHPRVPPVVAPKLSQAIETLRNLRPDLQTILPTLRTGPLEQPGPDLKVNKAINLLTEAQAFAKDIEPELGRVYRDKIELLLAEQHHHSKKVELQGELNQVEGITAVTRITGLTEQVKTNLKEDVDAAGTKVQLLTAIYELAERNYCNPLADLNDKTNLSFATMQIPWIELPDFRRARKRLILDQGEFGIDFAAAYQMIQKDLAAVTAKVSDHYQKMRDCDDPIREARKTMQERRTALEEAESRHDEWLEEYQAFERRGSNFDVTGIRDQRRAAERTRSDAWERFGRAVEELQEREAEKAEHEKEYHKNRQLQRASESFKGNVDEALERALIRFHGQRRGRREYKRVQSALENPQMGAQPLAALLVQVGHGFAGAGNRPAHGVYAWDCQRAVMALLESELNKRTLASAQPTPASGVQGAGLAPQGPLPRSRPLGPRRIHLIPPPPSNGGRRQHL